MGAVSDVAENFLKDAYPCKFPVLNEPLTTAAEIEWLFVKSEPAIKFSSPLDVSNVHAAFAVLLSLYVGQDDVSFLSASDLAGNSEAAAARLVSVTVEKQSKASDLVDACHGCLFPSDPDEHPRLSQLNERWKDQSKISTMQCNAFLILGHSKDDLWPLISNICQATDLLLVVSTYSLGSKPDLILWYRPHLLSSGAARSILNTYGQVLTEFKRDAARSIHDMALLSPDDIQLLTRWNSNVPASSDRCVHHLFEEQARANPTKTAVCSSDVSLTYTELDAYALRLSSKLRSHGVCVGDVILLCFEKSVWAVVSQLAVFKSGGACSFLHLEFPPARSQKIAEMSRARIALASPNTASMLSHLELDVLEVTQNSIEELELAPTYCNENLEADTRSPAFILFTSGSTGTPKGIIIDHSAVCTSFLVHGPIMMLKENARVLQFAAYTWDASVAEIWTTLLFGGTVCVPSEEDRVDRLAKIIDAFQITQIWLTPTVACLLNPSDVPSLKRLFLIGEPATRDAIDRWADRLDLRNAYGPTEACMFCSCTESLVVGCETRNVGYSFGGQVFAVDPDNPATLLPPGAIGELVVSGPIISKSYLDSAEETAAAFCARPEWPAETKITSGLERMYRTGDLGRMTAEGRLWHCGRRDNQVKLHGHRIQVDDIQHNLNQCLDFEFNIVVEVVEPNGNETRPILAAFVPIPGLPDTESNEAFVLPPNPDITRKLRSIAHDLRTRGAEQLPAYMIPTLYLPVSHVPRSRSGKLDRSALKDYVTQRSLAALMAYNASEKDDQQDLTAHAEGFVTMLADVLQLPADLIHLSQNFTELGGDSICAIRLADIGRRNGFDLSVADILRARSMNDLVSTKTGADSSKTSPVVNAFELVDGDPASREILIVDAAQQCDVSRNEIQDVYPCTPLQGGMFILSQKRPGSYIAQYHFQLDSDVDLNRYKAAWQTVFSHSEVLRTRLIYSPDASGILQTIVREDIQWAHGTDFEMYSVSDKSRHMGAGDRLTRFAIIQDTNSIHVVLSLHHAIHDDWSLRLIFNNVSKLYQNLEIELSTPFRNFIKAISLPDREQAISYWNRELQGLDAAIFPNLPKPGYEPRATQQMKRRIPRPERHGAYTEATMLRAALCILIAKYTQSRDVLIGANVAGRSIRFEGIRTLVGPTLTTIPVRVLLDFDSSIGTFLSQIQTQSNSSLEYEHSGLDNIRQGTGVSCDFQTLLVVHLPASERERDPIVQPAGLHIIADSYGLMLEVSQGESESTVAATFDPHMMEHRQMQRFMNQFVHILERLRLNDHSTPLSSIDGCCPEDLVEIGGWNQASPEKVSVCVHQAFEEQVEKSPLSSAIATYDREITYQELNRLSSTLAQYLSRNGVGPESIIPICFGKSYLSIVAGISVLKAGGACTFLDPDHPRERLLAILETVDANTVICSEAARLTFGSINNLHVIPLTLGWIESLPVIAQWSSDKIQPNNLAFVVFTSGSTGEPKGIEQDHQAYCSVMMQYGATLGFAPGRRVFQFSANTWDVFLSDVLTSLTHGACVCVPSDDDRVSDLENSMRKLQVNQATLPPAVALLLQAKDVPRLDVLCVAGDLVPGEVLHRWADATRLINMYGPSEVTVWSSFHDGITPTSDPRNIGKGSGSSIWLVEPENPNLLAPVGAIGEIVISGPGLARGYLKDEGRTQTAFIPAPKWLLQLDKTQSRVYRTGDMAHFNSDGEIIFDGRRDSQVKLNGQRVELSGVQTELERSAHGFHISQIVAEVIQPDCHPGRQYLVAFVASDTTQEQDMEFMVSEMRARLTRSLPSFMVPSLFIGLSHIPLTRHGKLDRKKLRAQGSALRPEQLASHTYETGNTQFRAPNTQLEKDLRGLWAQVLTIDPNSISLNDSFGRLGGDSINAMKLVMLARSCDLKLTVLDVLQASDLADLASLTSRYNGTR